LLIPVWLPDQNYGLESPDISGSQFFDGRRRPGGIISLHLQGEKMTATAIVFTGSGFAVAADGNQLWGHKPTRNAAIRATETDSAQKIFGIEMGDTALAYIVRGDVANEDRTFDVALELKGEVALAVKRRRSKPKAFVEAIGNALERQIALAVEAGRLRCWPAPQITFFGFVGNDPFYVNLNFWPLPDANGLHYKIIGQVVDSWLFACSGSQVIAQMMQQSDVRIRQFIKPPNEKLSLHDAIDTTRGYIEACSSPLGLEVDPDNCQGLGGHIHVATVTPCVKSSWISRYFRRSGCSQSGGFQWVIPPIWHY
jgi:hypothetical protein